MKPDKEEVECLIAEDTLGFVLRRLVDIAHYTEQIDSHLDSIDTYVRSVKDSRDAIDRTRAQILVVVKADHRREKVSADNADFIIDQISAATRGDPIESHEFRKLMIAINKRNEGRS